MLPWLLLFKFVDPIISLILSSIVDVDVVDDDAVGIFVVVDVSVSDVDFAQLLFIVTTGHNNMHNI